MTDDWLGREIDRRRRGLIWLRRAVVFLWGVAAGAILALAVVYVAHLAGIRP